MPLRFWPQQLPRPSCALLAELGQSLPALAADSLMFWHYSCESEKLVAVYNPTLPQLCGFSQPLHHGTISQVFLTGLPILEHDLKSRPDHDPSLDQLHQKSTRSMIAAPVASPSEIIGILSAVQFSDSSEVQAFQLSHLDLLSSLSSKLAAAITSSPT